MRDSFSCYSGSAGVLFNASSEHSEIFISVFYPNWLILRKFYLNLLYFLNIDSQLHKEYEQKEKSN